MEKLEDPINRFLKRTLDIAVALPMVVFVLVPVSAVIWVLHRLQSPGPLFFRQIRARSQNREFAMIKFRTMHEAAADTAERAHHDKNRVFPSGRWLRRLGIDEIPQFLNVLRGEMSVVGPRPHFVGANAQFRTLMDRYCTRASFEPGIAGLAQIRGFRGDVTSIDDIRRRLESDIEYIENWSLGSDLTIIFWTALQASLFTIHSVLSSWGTTSVSRTGLSAPSDVTLEAAAECITEGHGSPRSCPEVRHILGIRFFAGRVEQAVIAAMEGGLMVAPSAPVLLGMVSDAEQRLAVANSRIAITDSGLMVMLWKLITGEKIERVSGLAYLKALLEQPEMRVPGNVFWVMPNAASMARNLSWLQAQGFSMSAEDCYIAPMYDSNKTTMDDVTLVKIVRSRRPKHIIMAVGGGIQEKLGANLQRHLDYQPAIHCTGAAIGFLSGDQVRIPMWADRWRLGWLCRCISEPSKFIPRYWEARKLVNLMFQSFGRLPGPALAIDAKELKSSATKIGSIRLATDSVEAT